MFIQVGVTRPDTQVIQTYKHMRKQTCLSTDTRKKEGLTKPVYLHRPFTSLDHHLGGAPLVVVEFYVEPVRRGGVVV